MKDGMSTESFVGTDITATNLSGTNAAFGSSTIDTTEIQDAAVTSAKLADDSVVTAKISGLSVTDAKLAVDSVVTAKISGLAVSTAKIAAEAVTVPKQAFVGTGSPTVWGNGMQFGVGTLGAGSDVWIVYGTPFKAAPVFVATSKNDSAINILGAGSGTNQGIGSVHVLGTTASTTFNWVACGSM